MGTARFGLFKCALRRLTFGEIGQGGKKMYAIIANGSKQYKAVVGDTIKFEKLEANVGEKVEFEVLLLSDENGIKLGADVAGVKAVGEVIAQDKAKKVVVFKYKAKKNIRKKQGHRQPFTAVKIETIG